MPTSAKYLFMVVFLNFDLKSGINQGFQEMSMLIMVLKKIEIYLHVFPGPKWALHP